MVMKKIILIITAIMLLSSPALAFDLSEFERDMDIMIKAAAKETDSLLADEIKALYLTPEEIKGMVPKPVQK